MWVSECECVSQFIYFVCDERCGKTCDCTWFNIECVHVFVQSYSIVSTTRIHTVSVLVLNLNWCVSQQLCMPWQKLENTIKWKTKMNASDRMKSCQFINWFGNEWKIMCNLSIEWCVLVQYTGLFQWNKWIALGNGIRMAGTGSIEFNEKKTCRPQLSSRWQITAPLCLTISFLCVVFRRSLQTNNNKKSIESMTYSQWLWK